MSKLETVDDLGAIQNGLFYGRSMKYIFIITFKNQKKNLKFCLC